jgi:hypothetical protein
MTSLWPLSSIVALPDVILEEALNVVADELVYGMLP